MLNETFNPLSTYTVHNITQIAANADPHVLELNSTLPRNGPTTNRVERTASAQQALAEHQREEAGRAEMEWVEETLQLTKKQQQSSIVKPQLQVQMPQQHHR